MTKAVIVFFICLGVYLLVLLGIFIFKKITAKRNFNKRLKEEQENQEGANHEEKQD